jgi:hypothetical protein
MSEPISNGAPLRFLVDDPTVKANDIQQHGSGAKPLGTGHSDGFAAIKSRVGGRKCRFTKSKLDVLARI